LKLIYRIQILHDSYIHICIFNCLILGLDNIRLLVTHGYTVLRVELEDLAESVYAEYDSFYIAGEDDKYRINLSGYSGTAGTFGGQSMVQQLKSYSVISLFIH
jgi:hypothetical protein